jgi:type II secretory pathway pseudopilin PulG
LEEGMNRLISVTALALCVVAGLAARSSAQTAVDEDGRRAALRVMRAINTAENAARSQGGHYLPLADLLTHRAMGAVAPDVRVSATTVTYDKWQLRLALSADASQYMVNMMSSETCGLAVFSDERGLIYTGKVLDC